jgi:predicted TIM-barrel fold metal-dependent hydrolase
MVISSDCHGGLPTPDYRDYLEPEFRDDLDRYLAEQSEMASIRPTDRPGMRDRDRRVTFATVLPARLAELESDGIVGEVVFPDGGQGNEVPFTSGGFGGVGRRSPMAHQAAAHRAYNRWLGEHCAPNRQIGLALVSLHDPVAARAEVDRLRDLGLLGVYPIFDGADDAVQLYSPELDPVWAACADLDLTVNFHEGTGMPLRLYAGERGKELFFYEGSYWGRRTLWHMILGGVCERHPRLRIVFTELGCDWIPPTLAAMDARWELGRARAICPRPPSEYWRRQGYVGASGVSRHELGMRDHIGVDAMMFGTDHAHSVATWDCTSVYLRMTFGAAHVPEAEARAMLGGNLARLYSLDVEQLAPIVDRVGPLVEDVLAQPDAETIERIPEYLRTVLRGLADRVPAPVG